MRQSDAIEAFSVSKLIDRIASQAREKQFGWRSIDDQGIGVGAGDLVLIAGRTGHGKSAALVNLMMQWLEAYQDQSFVFVSYEMPPEAIFLRALSILTRRTGAGEWSYQDIRKQLQPGRGAIRSEDETQDLVDAVAHLKQLEKRIIVVYQPKWHAELLVEHLTSLSAERGPLGAIFVDYMQIVPPPEGQYFRRELEVEAVAHALKRLAVAIECPILAGAQIDSNVARLHELIPHGLLEDQQVMEAIAKRRPQLHHLSDGGEQEADLVIGLLNYQADYMAGREETETARSLREQSGSAAPFECSVIKNRHGALASAKLVLEARTGYIRDPGVFGR